MAHTSEEERGPLHYEFGTVRRGMGAAIHNGRKSYNINPSNGRAWYVSIGADCNSNGQMAGRDFKEGKDRAVTCTRCRQINGTAPAVASPSERVPGPDSCQAKNKTTGKQCTFKAQGNNRCNNHQGKQGSK